MNVEMDNNIVSGGRPYLTEDASHGAVAGSNNWMPTDTNPGTLVGTVFGANPFQNPASRDFTLAPNSMAIGTASNSVNALPDKEYFQNETATRMYRVRTAARDIGAFESTTTGNGIGPYDKPSAQNGAHGCTSSGALTNGLISLLPLALLALRRKKA